MSTQTFHGDQLIARHLNTARTRAGTSGDLEADNAYQGGPVTEDPILTAAPFLETLPVTAKKHPYATLITIVGAVATVVSTVVGAVVFVAIGAFTMYGTQRETLSELKALRQDYTEVSTRLAAIQKQQTDDMNAVRAYASNDARRTEFIVGLMTPTQQRAVNQFDRSNPRMELPGVPGKREQ